MGRLNESVHVTYLAAEERDVQVSRLHEPWIGDEGPLEAGFRRGSGAGPLRPRGFAFDQRTTVVWDEAGVQVLRPSEPTPEVTALDSPVVVRHWYSGPARLIRIDYMDRGCLVGSRYVASDEAGSQQGERDA
jgi:hypothetical protein